MPTAEPWVTHRLGRAQIALPPEMQLAGADFMVRGVELREEEPPPGDARAAALEDAWAARVRTLLDDQEWKRTILHDIPLGPRARGAVVEERGLLQAAEAYVETEASLLRLRNADGGQKREALIAPVRQVMGAYRRATAAEASGPLDPAVYHLQRGVVALPFDHQEGERVGASWKRPGLELALEVKVARKARETGNPVVALVEALVEWNARSEEHITQLRGRDLRVAGVDGVETVLRQREHVSFGWRNFARRKYDVELIVDLDGSVAELEALERVWQRVLCEVRVGELLPR